MSVDNLSCPDSAYISWRASGDSGLRYPAFQKATYNTIQSYIDRDMFAPRLVLFQFLHIYNLPLLASRVSALVVKIASLSFTCVNHQCRLFTVFDLPFCVPHHGVDCLFTSLFSCLDLVHQQVVVVFSPSSSTYACLPRYVFNLWTRFYLSSSSTAYSKPFS